MLDTPLSQWPRLSVLLDELLDLDPQALAQRLAALHAEEPDIAAAVEALLGRQAAIDREGFLLQPAQMPGETAPGQVVGAYQIEREIGQGGMGSVWLARRTDGRFEGRVAIKFLAAGFASRGGAARFTREGSILARLAHPHIARLLDAGLAPGRQPYLVLDYVDGLVIDQFCDVNGLDATARVRLCLDVLDAVAHAHTRLILHRDIKPSNILVTAQGEVKLLDFGIAKLLDSPTGSGSATELTRESGSAFTMLYAAPEQVQGGDVTTATDVYALGVLLHLLLTGLHPGGAATTPLERMRALVEVVPPPMSVALRQAGDLKRARPLQGDLDTIVAVALKKLPAERYANAERLADELRRWLTDEPILARREARLYRLRKFIRRYRAGVAIGALAFATLSLGIGVALWQAGEAHGQRVQAEGLIEFMLGDLRAKLQPVGRLDALDAVGSRALAYYAAQSEGRLDAESLGRRSRALHLIGEIAESRGKLDEAIRVFGQAERSTAALLARAPQEGQRIFDHAQSVYWVGYIAWRQGRLQEAEADFSRYEILAQQLIAQDPAKPAWQAELAYAQQNLGSVLLGAGRFAEARAKLLLAQAQLKRLVGTQPELGNNLGWVARTDERLGHLGQAIAGLQAQIALLKAPQPGADKDKPARRDLAVSLSELARLELARGSPQWASESAAAALAIMDDLSRADPANTAWQQDRGWAHLRLADALRHVPAGLAQARLHTAAALALAQGLAAKDASVTRWAVNMLGQALVLQAQTADPAQREAAIDALRRWLNGLPPANADTTRSPTVAHAALLLGDHFSAKSQALEARSFWALAAAQVADDDPTPALVAAACAARASARLGDMARARLLGARLQATEFQHPDYAGLVNTWATP